MSLKSQYLHFDSTYSTYISDPTNTSGNMSNCYKSMYTTVQSLKNIKRVHLKSVELPIGFVNIRTGSTDTLRFRLNGNVYNVVLGERNYTTIASLVTAINTACVDKVPDVTITFSSTTSINNPNRLLITFTGAVITSTFSIIDTNLSMYVLGFRSLNDRIRSQIGNLPSVYAATSSNCNLNFDNYINMYIPTLNGMNASTSGMTTTFKIPLNASNNQIYYYFDNSSFSQYVDISDSKLILSNLTVIILDRFGQNINPNGLDWSWTILVDYLA